MSSLILNIIGGPASGKGTLHNRLVKYFTKEHALSCACLSTGEKFRKEAEHNPELKRIMALGDFVPNQIVVPIVKGLLEEAAGNHDVLFLDGAVRTVTQLYHVCKFAKVNGCLHVVMYIGTPHYILEERLTRLAKTMERGRNDDNIVSIPRRLRNHWNMTEVIRRILEKHQTPNFRSFDGTLHPDKIFSEVTTFLDSFNIFPKVEASA